MEGTEEFDAKIEAQLAKLLSKTKEGFDKQLRALQDKFSSDLSIVQSKLDIALSRVAPRTATASQTTTAGVLDKASPVGVTSNGTTDSARMAINLITHFPKSASSIYLMKILLLQKNGIARRVFARMGIDNSLLLKIAQDFTESWPKVGDEFTGLSSEHDLEELLKRANEYKMEFRDPLVSVDHLVLALAHNKLFKVLFDKFKLTPETLKDALLAKNRYIHRDMEGINEPLAKSCKNLSAMAKAGNLDPVIGRDTEISRCISILCRKDRNNLILIGDPGVGKTAIVHGIAQRIEERNVPQVLMDKQIILLDIIAAKEINRGGINLWLKSILNDIAKFNGEMILFIDDVHSLLGHAEGSIDASLNLLKSMLVRENLKFICATPTTEFQNCIAKDTAFRRCFEEVQVERPTIEMTVNILRGLRVKYEVHHGVRISDEAIIVAPRLLDRFVFGSCLPEKATHLIDEAALARRVSIDSKPSDLDGEALKVKKLKIDRVLLLKDDDETSKIKLAKVDEELSQLEKSCAQSNEGWQTMKTIMDRVDWYLEEIHLVKRDIKQAEKENDLVLATTLKHEVLKSLERQCDAVKEEENKSLVRFGYRNEVSRNDVAEIISQWTGNPIDRVEERGMKNLLSIEGRLREHIIGQDQAVISVADALRRSQAGLSDPDRPIASFMFMGPTGVGKTEVAKALAFTTAKTLIRIDMSEYGESQNVSRMIGAPPGYRGYEEAGQLTESVRKSPYAVILFDEIEKAHPDIFSIFLQILDEGRLTDSHGHTVSFADTMIIMTTNVGANYILDLGDDISITDDDYKTTEKGVMEKMRSIFTPEFLNRLDEFIMFRPLNCQQIRSVVQLQLNRLRKRLADRKMKMEVTEGAMEFLGERGYDRRNGARPVKRAIQKYVENEVAKGILGGEFKEGDTVVIDSDNTNDRLVMVHSRLG